MPRRNCAAVPCCSSPQHYVLTLAVLIPVNGRLAHRFGTRRVFCTALAAFVLASGAYALAPDLATLTLARSCRAQPLR